MWLRRLLLRCGRSSHSHARVSPFIVLWCWFVVLVQGERVAGVLVAALLVGPQNPPRPLLAAFPLVSVPPLLPTVLVVVLGPRPSLPPLHSAPLPQGSVIPPQPTAALARQVRLSVRMCVWMWVLQFHASTTVDASVISQSRPLRTAKISYWLSFVVLVVFVVVVGCA